MQFSGEMEKINVSNFHGPRPFCPCCGGGDYRPGYTCTKYASLKQNRKAKRGDKKVDRKARAFNRKMKTVVEY